MAYSNNLRALLYETLYSSTNYDKATIEKKIVELTTIEQMVLRAEYCRKILQLKEACKYYRLCEGILEVAELFNYAATLQTLGDYSSALQLYKKLNVSSSARDLASYRFQIIECARQAKDYDYWQELIVGLNPIERSSLSGIRVLLEESAWRGTFTQITELVEQSVIAPAWVAEIDELEEILFIILYFDCAPEVLKKLYDRYEAAKVSTAEVIPLSSTVRNNTKKLRVGYLSPDFRDHVMGRMISIPILNREETEAFCYFTDVREDALTKQIERSSDVFVRCSSLTDIQIAQRIAADNIDILIDVSGHTFNARPGVMRLKPAPLSMTHVGNAGPLGLRAVNYKLSDHIADTEDNQQYIIERLAMMDSSCYPVPAYPAVKNIFNKTEFGLENHLCIGAFFTHYKLSERCLRLWANVLSEIPQAVLVFSPLDSALQEVYLRLCWQSGISAERVRFVPCGNTLEQQLARYQVIDFVCDSMPYGGVNGSLEALYMGVPVISLLGQRHCERTTASILSTLGVTELVAKTPQDYIDLAKACAKQDIRTQISQKIKKRWPQYADPKRYTEDWEKLLMSLYEEHRGR